MDQEQLYENQVERDLNVNEVDLAVLKGRDQFVLDYMRSYCSYGGVKLNVAELSIGEGRMTRSLLQQFPHSRILGLDISTSRIQHVRKSIEKDHNFDSKNVRFIQCNFDTNFSQVSEGSQEVVVALDILEHVFDVFGFVENCHRILVTGGLLFIRVPNIAYIKHRFALLAGCLPVTSSWFGTAYDLNAWKDTHGWDGGHLHLFTIPILFQLLDQFDFEVEICRDPGTRLEKLRNFWPEAFYSNPLVVARAL